MGKGGGRGSPVLILLGFFVGNVAIGFGQE